MIFAICGVQREARIAERGGGVIAIPGGGNAAALEACLHAAILPACQRGEGVRGIISFGLCGALAPGLKVGEWIIGSGVTGGFDCACDERWARHLLTSLRRPGLDPGRCFSSSHAHEEAQPRIKSGATEMKGAVHHGPVFADGTLASTAQAKAALHARTGALAIDMESHVAAKVAADHRLPFAILRVISDTAADALPPAFAVAMRPDGGTDIAAMLGSLARNPAQLLAFIRAARNATTALRQLSLGRDLLGPGLGLPHLG